MGFADAFGKEDRMEITVNQLQSILMGVVERDVILRGVVNRIPHSHIETMIYGNKSPLQSNEDKEENNNADKSKEKRGRRIEKEES